MNGSQLSATRPHLVCADGMVQHCACQHIALAVTGARLSRQDARHVVALADTGRGSVDASSSTVIGSLDNNQHFCVAARAWPLATVATMNGQRPAFSLGYTTA